MKATKPTTPEYLNYLVNLTSVTIKMRVVSIIDRTIMLELAYIDPETDEIFATSDEQHTLQAGDTFSLHMPIPFKVEIVKN